MFHIYGLWLPLPSHSLPSFPSSFPPSLFLLPPIGFISLENLEQFHVSICPVPWQADLYELQQWAVCPLVSSRFSQWEMIGDEREQGRRMRSGPLFHLFLWFPPCQITADWVYLRPPLLAAGPSTSIYSTYCSFRPRGICGILQVLHHSWSVSTILTTSLCTEYLIKCFSVVPLAFHLFPIGILTLSIIYYCVKKQSKT